MLGSVKFNREFLFSTIEIQYIIFDRMLTPELISP